MQRRRERFAATLFVAIVAHGCALGRDYRRPFVPTPEITRGQKVPAGDETIADLGWWEMFEDPALQALLVEGLEANHDLAAAAARVEQARQIVAVTRSELFPQVDVRGDAARQRSEIAAGKSTFNTFQSTLNLAWEIDLWGRIRRATEASAARLWAAEDVRRGVLLMVMSDIARNYFELLGLDRELAVAHQSSDTFRATLDLFNRRFEGGIGTLLEVSRARAALANSEAQVPDLEREITTKENQISILVGRLPGPITRGKDLTKQTVHARVPVGLPSDLLERRPDLVEAEDNVTAANAEVGAALASFFPRIGLTTFYGGQSTDLADLVRSGSDIWSIGASVSSPLFQGGRLVATYRARDAELAEAIERYLQSTLRAFGEVSSLLVTHDRLRRVRVEREEAVEQLRISVDLSLSRYRDGVANYIEVLEAQQQYFPSEIALVRTQREQLVTMVNLYRALGGGWKL